MTFACANPLFGKKIMINIWSRRKQKSKKASFWHFMIMTYSGSMLCWFVYPYSLSELIRTSLRQPYQQGCPEVFLPVLEILLLPFIRFWIKSLRFLVTESQLFDYIAYLGLLEHDLKKTPPDPANQHGIGPVLRIITAAPVSYLHETRMEQLLQFPAGRPSAT